MALLKKHWMPILAAALIAMVVLPFLMLAFFTFPSADDYSSSMWYSSNLAEAFTWERITSVINFIISKGYAIIAIPAVLFSPFRYFGITGLRVTVFLMNAMFVFSCFVFVKWVLKGVFKDESKLHWMIAYFLYILCFIAFRYQAEMFTWVTGSTGYLFPVSCLHLGLAFYIKASLFPKKRFWIASLLLGILGAMSVTSITALVCGLYVASLFLLMVNRKCGKWAMAVALAVAAAGVATLFSPGLYARHDSFSTSYNLYAAFAITIEAVWESTQLLWRSPAALVFFLLALLSFRWFPASRKVHWMNLGVALLVALLGPIVVMFPQFLGYGYKHLPSRAQFVMDLVLILGFSGAIVCLCAFVKSRVGDVPMTKKAAIPLIVVFALLGGSIFVSYDFRELIPLKIVHDAADGKLMRTYQYWTKTLAKWEQSEGQDVLVLDLEQNGYSLPYFVYPEISCFVNEWRNEDIAKYYRLNSICRVSYVDYHKEK